MLLVYKEIEDGIRNRKPALGVLHNRWITIMLKEKSYRVTV